MRGESVAYDKGIEHFHSLCDYFQQKKRESLSRFFHLNRFPKKLNLSEHYRKNL